MYLSGGFFFFVFCLFSFPFISSLSFGIWKLKEHSFFLFFSSFLSFLFFLFSYSCLSLFFLFYFCTFFYIFLLWNYLLTCSLLFHES